MAMSLLLLLIAWLPYHAIPLLVPSTASYSIRGRELHRRATSLASSAALLASIESFKEHASGGNRDGEGYSYQLANVAGLFASNINELNPSQITVVLKVLGNSDLTLDKLGGDVAQSLETKLAGLSFTSMSMKECIELFYGLSQVKINWRKLEYNARLQLEMTLEHALLLYINNNVPDEQFDLAKSMFRLLLLLGNIRVDYNNTGHSTQQRLRSSIFKLVHVMNQDGYSMKGSINNVCNLVYALGLMGISYYKDINIDQEGLKFKAFVVKYISRAPKIVQWKALLGLAKLGFKWNRADINTRKSIEKVIVSCFTQLFSDNKDTDSSSDMKQVVTLIACLHSIGITWASLDMTTQDTIEHILVSGILATSSGAGVISSKFLLHLAELGVNLDNFRQNKGVSIRYHIIEELKQHQHSLRSWELIEYVSALAKLAFSYEDIVKIKLLDSIHTKKKLIGPTSTADLVLGTGVLLSRPSRNNAEISVEYKQLLRDLVMKWITKMKITDMAKLVRGFLLLSASSYYDTQKVNEYSILFFESEGLCDNFQQACDHSQLNQLLDSTRVNSTSSIVTESSVDYGVGAGSSLSKSLIVSSTIRRLQAEFRSVNLQQVVAFIKILRDHGVDSRVLQLHKSTTQLIETRIIQILNSIVSHQESRHENDAIGDVVDLLAGLVSLRGTWDNLQLESRLAIKRWLNQYDWPLCTDTTHKRQRISYIRLHLAVGMLRVPLSRSANNSNLNAHIANLIRCMESADEYAGILLALGGTGFEWSDTKNIEIKNVILSKQYLLEDLPVKESNIECSDILASIVTGLSACNASHSTLPEHYSRQLYLLTNKLIDDEWILDGTVKVLVTILQGLGAMNILPSVTAKVTLNIIKYFQQHVEYSSQLLPSAEYVPLLTILPLLYSSEKNKKYSKVVGDVRCVTMEIVASKLMTSKTYLSGKQYLCVLGALHRATEFTAPSYTYSNHLRSELVDQFIVLLSNKKFSESELLQSLHSLTELNIAVEDFHRNSLGFSVQEIENIIRDICPVASIPLFNNADVDSMPIEMPSDMTLEELRHNFNTLRPSALPNTLWLCHQLKYSAQDIRKSGLLALIDKSILEHISSWDSNHAKLCMLLNVLHKLHLPEHYLSESTRKAILASLTRQTPSMDSRCVHNALYFIAKLEYKSFENTGLQHALKNAFIRRSKMMLLFSGSLHSSREYPNALWGLSNLAQHGLCLTTDEVNIILLSIIKCGDQFNARDIATIFASFKLLQLPWELLTTPMVPDTVMSHDEAVAPGIALLNRLAASDLDNVILDSATLSLLIVSLGKIGCTVDMIPAVSRVTILRAINQALDHWEMLTSKELYWITIGLGYLGWEIQSELTKDRMDNMVRAFQTHISNPKITTNGLVSLLNGVAALKVDIAQVIPLTACIEGALMRIVTNSVESGDDLVLLLEKLCRTNVTYGMFSSRLHSTLINKLVASLCSLQSEMIDMKSIRASKSLHRLVSAFSTLLVSVSDELVLYTIFQMSDKVTYNQRFLHHIASVKSSVTPAFIKQKSDKRWDVGLFEVFDTRLFNIINTGINPAGIIAILNSVKKLNLVKDLPSCTPVLFAACSMIAATLDGRTFLKMLLVLAELKLQWTDFQQEQQVSIISGIARTISHKPNRMVTLLPLLIDLKVPYNDLHKGISLILRFVIFQVFNGTVPASNGDINHDGLLHLITNLSKMGATSFHLGDKAYLRIQEYVTDIKDPVKRKTYAAILTKMSE